MKKWLGIGVALVVVAAIAIAVVVHLAFDTALRKGIEVVAPKITGTSVTVENLALRPLAGSARLEGVKVGNPEGFATDSAFKLGLVSVSMKPRSLLSDRIVVNSIVIEGPEITYERSLSSSNIAKILEHVEKLAGSSEDAPEKPEEPEEPSEPGKKLQINDFVIRNAKVNVSATLLAGKALTVTIPEIHLTDIGAEKEGASLPEVVSEVLGEVSRAVVETVAAAGDLGKGLGDSAKEVGESAKGALQSLRGVFSKPDED